MVYHESANFSYNVAEKVLPRVDVAQLMRAPLYWLNWAVCKAVIWCIHAPVDIPTLS